MFYTWYAVSVSAHQGDTTVAIETLWITVLPAFRGVPMPRSRGGAALPPEPGEALAALLRASPLCTQDSVSNALLYTI